MKRLLCLVCCLVGAIAWAGCGGDGPQQEGEAEKQLSDARERVCQVARDGTPEEDLVTSTIYALEWGMGEEQEQVRRANQQLLASRPELSEAWQAYTRALRAVQGKIPSLDGEPGR